MKHGGLAMLSKVPRVCLLTACNSIPRGRFLGARGCLWFPARALGESLHCGVRATRCKSGVGGSPQRTVFVEVLCTGGM